MTEQAQKNILHGDLQEKEKEKEKVLVPFTSSIGSKIALHVCSGTK
jgi:hypothetical protein